eukprot:gene18697-22537_t
MSKKAPKGQGSRTKLRDYFIENVGVVLDSDTLREIAGTSEWGRRVRELRNEEGLNIITHNDRSSLKPGEYMLVNLKPMCGAAAGEPNPYDANRKTRLHIGHIIDKSMGGTDDQGNLRAICSVCNEGASNLTLNRPQ